MTPRSRFERAWSWLLSVMALALAVLVVVLSLQNRALKQALASERERPRASQSERRFERGDVWPPGVALRRTDGVESPIALDGAHKTLLFFRADGCAVCPQAFDTWQELAPLFADAHARVAAVQLDRPWDSEHAARGIELCTLVKADAALIAKLTTVPLTLLFDGNGVVEFAHYGALTETQLVELAALLPRG